MTRLFLVPSRVGTALLLLVASSSPLLAQRADRGIIGGVVTDAQAAPLVGATVTIQNEATGVETVLVTNDSGAYTTGLLVLGPYTVKVNLSGFKTAVTTGINLRGGDVIRHDVTLPVGQLTETVDVTADEGLNKTQ